MSQVKILNDYLMPDITDIIMNYNLPEFRISNNFWIANQLEDLISDVKEDGVLSENRTCVKYYDIFRYLKLKFYCLIEINGEIRHTVNRIY